MTTSLFSSSRACRACPRTQTTLITSQLSQQKNLGKAGKTFIDLVKDISNYNHGKWLSKGEKNITDVIRASRI